MQVLVKRLHNDVVLPEYKTPGAAGMDLRARLDASLSIAPGQTVLIPTGIALHIADPNVACVLLPRSGLGANEGLVLGNLVGLIDSDYQGELFVAAWNRNLSGGAIVVKPGDRIAQAAFVPVIQVELKEVSEFRSTSERGSGGFGSTGTSIADEASHQ